MSKIEELFASAGRMNRIPFVVRIETQVTDEEIADFAVPATILNEPERAQANVVETPCCGLGLELTDTGAHALAAFVDHPHDIVGRDMEIGWIVWFAPDSFEKGSPFGIVPAFWRNDMLLRSRPAPLSKTQNGHAA